MKRSCSLDAQRGFSLLEVVVAFAILALALGTLSQVFSSMAQRTALLQSYSRAVLLADAKLTEIAAGRLHLPEQESGDFDDVHHWRSRVVLYEEGARSEAGAPDDTDYSQASLYSDRLKALLPYLITVEVYWGQGEGQRSVALSTVRLRVGG